LYNYFELNENGLNFLDIQVLSNKKEKWENYKVELPINFNQGTRVLSSIHFDPSSKDVLIFANFFKENSSNINEDEFYNNVFNIDFPGYIKLAFEVRKAQDKDKRI
jgi:hypothetical protein